MNLIQIMLIFVILTISLPLHNCPNPSDLFLTNETELDDSDNDAKSSRLFHDAPLKKTISPKPRTADFTFHLHLVKVIWNKIQADNAHRKSIESNTGYPISIGLNLRLSREMVNDITRYIADTDNSSDTKHQARINTHILNNLEIFRCKACEEPAAFQGGPMEPWYETKWFLYSVMACMLSSFILTAMGRMGKWTFFALIVALCVLHKGIDIYEDNELKRSQIIAHEIPEHCGETTSLWIKMMEAIRISDRRKECRRLEKEAGKKSVHSLNILRVITALMSDGFVELFGSVGILVGRTYDGLQQYLGWFWSPVFLLVLIIGPLMCCTYAIINILPAWWMRRPIRNHKNQDNNNYRIGNRSNSNSIASSDEIEDRHRSTNRKRDRMHFVVMRQSNYSNRRPLRIKHS